MLDDLKLFHEKDTADTLGAVEHEYKQLEHSFVLKGRPKFDDVGNVVYVGMGGSALAALFVQVWPGLTKPFEVVRGYDIPQYVDASTLVIAASTSGNTEEMLSALTQAQAKGAKVAVITSGGELQRIAEENDYPLALLPKTTFSRCNLLFSVCALLQIIETAGVLGGSYQSELEKAARFLSARTQAWCPDVPTPQNRAKQIAQELLGKSVVIYAGPKMYPAAYKWKIGFNENAKQVAWVNQYPEFNHNEFTGWSKQPVDKPYAIIELRSSFEHPQVQKRFEISERLLSGMRPAAIVIASEGDTLLEQLLWNVVLGDFVSLYLAFASGVNPALLPLVDKLKGALNA